MEKPAGTRTLSSIIARLILARGPMTTPSHRMASSTTASGPTLTPGERIDRATVPSMIQPEAMRESSTVTGWPPVINLLGGRSCGRERMGHSGSNNSKVGVAPKRSWWALK